MLDTSCCPLLQILLLERSLAFVFNRLGNVQDSDVVA